MSGKPLNNANDLINHDYYIVNFEKIGEESYESRKSIGNILLFKKK